MQDIGEVEWKLRKINQEINKLMENKKKYKTMISKIDNTITELKASKSQVSNALGLFKKCYTSSVSKNRYSEFTSRITEIDGIISDLNSIIQNSEAKINSLTSEIRRKTDRKLELKRQLKFLYANKNNSVKPMDV